MLNLTDKHVHIYNRYMEYFYEKRPKWAQGPKSFLASNIPKDFGREFVYDAYFILNPFRGASIRLVAVYLINLSLSVSLGGDIPQRIWI